MVLTCTHNQCFEQKEEKYNIFSSKIILFTALKNGLSVADHPSSGSLLTLVVILASVALAMIGVAVVAYVTRKSESLLFL